MIRIIIPKIGGSAYQIKMNALWQSAYRHFSADEMVKKVVTLPSTSLQGAIFLKVVLKGIKPPTYLSINTLSWHQALNLFEQKLTGHQAPNVLSKGSRASSP
ncbi:hypothetical protein MTR_4g069270 [Medicago truncatula]|uniref:Uncharacterized protein n=1 Tax=Medicago truncatula TaxID=3880 RepID=A0A072UL59_MEDTR|nr:hypothetical protein MTR_4g069270 [Medicago truncatula]